MNDKEVSKRVPQQWLQWMPNWMEFGLVFFLTLWPFVYSSITALLTTLPDTPITENHLIGLVVGEVFILILVLPFMYARGWTVSTLGLQFQKSDLLKAIVLWVLVYVGYVALWYLFALTMPEATKAASDVKLVAPQISMSAVVVASAMNGFFEELFVAGYLIQSIRSRFGVMTAINISVLVRLSYHLYQGPIAVIGLVPFGLVFAWAFVRTGRLWPLVLAHVLQDILALS